MECSSVKVKVDEVEVYISKGGQLVKHKKEKEHHNAEVKLISLRTFFPPFILSFLSSLYSNCAYLTFKPQTREIKIKSIQSFRKKPLNQPETKQQKQTYNTSLYKITALLKKAGCYSSTNSFSIPFL